MAGAPATPQHEWVLPLPGAHSLSWWGAGRCSEKGALKGWENRKGHIPWKEPWDEAAHHNSRPTLPNYTWDHWPRNCHYHNEQIWKWAGGPSATNAHSCIGNSAEDLKGKGGFTSATGDTKGAVGEPTFTMCTSSAHCKIAARWQLSY